MFYEKFLEALRRNPRFVANEAAADVLFPLEDTAIETNWPRYGNPSSAFVRGRLDRAAVDRYLAKLAADDRRLCVVNMHPFLRRPLALRTRDNIVVADGSLPVAERQANPRTVSVPALPIVPQPEQRLAKTILASFRGAPSHPCRAELFKLHDGTAFICEAVAQRNHAGRIDAIARTVDRPYADLLARSTFAFVPRGDALFSYRLLETMAAGAIPIVISDGWVLPFDRTIPWAELALHVPERDIAGIPALLRGFEPERIAAMQRALTVVYERHLANLDRIVGTLLGEVERILA